MMIMSALTLPFFRPLNALVVPIQCGGLRRYFFVDTGAPYSFSESIDSIPADHSPTQTPFELHSAPFDLRPLSDVLGLEIDGFLGIDFLSACAYLGIDYAARQLHFNVIDHTKLFVEAMAFPLQDGPVVMATFGGGKPLPCYVDTGSFLCSFFGDDPPECPFQRSGLRYPTAKGIAQYSMQTPCEITLSGRYCGEHTIAVGAKRGPFDGIIGNNFLCRYNVLFDWRNMHLRLLASPAAVEDWQEPLPHLNGPGFQITAPPKCSPRRLLVSHRSALSGLNPSFQPGKTFDLPGLNWENPEVINDALSRLSRAGSIAVLTDEGPHDLETAPLFRPLVP